MDAEKQVVAQEKNLGYIDDSSVEQLYNPPKSFQSLRRIVAWFGAEEEGVERIMPDQRTDQKPISLFYLFSSVNVNAATVEMGVLAPSVYGLGWWDSFTVIIIFNLFSAIFPAIFATFGPKFGLRTMMVPRYAFGFYPSKVITAVCCISSLGWAVCNTLAGANILYFATAYKCPLSICVLIIALVASFLCFMGYRYVHMFERYCWLIVSVGFFICLGFGGKNFSNIPMPSGKFEASDVLTFGASIISFQWSWATMACDLGCKMREDVSSKKVFTYSYLGFFLSQTVFELLGAAFYTACFGPRADAYTDAFNKAGVGGLIGEGFMAYNSSVVGFGRFVMFILGLSSIAVVVTNVYSVGLCVQMVDPVYLMRIPRFVWTFIGAVIFTVLSIVGRNSFSDVISDFLLCLDYYLSPLLFIVLTEHYLFRRNRGYNLNGYNDKHILPLGIAASVAYIPGCALGFLCMDQTWAVSPIAKAIGPGDGLGTDIGWILGLVSVPIYIPVRMWELRKYKR